MESIWFEANVILKGVASGAKLNAPVAIDVILLLFKAIMYAYFWLNAPDGIEVIRLLDKTMSEIGLENVKISTGTLVKELYDASNSPKGVIPLAVNNFNTSLIWVSFNFRLVQLSLARLADDDLVLPQVQPKREAADGQFTAEVVAIVATFDEMRSTENNILLVLGLLQLI